MVKNPERKGTSQKGHLTKSNHEISKRPTILERKDSDILWVRVCKNSVGLHLFFSHNIRIIKNMIKKNQKEHRNYCIKDTDEFITMTEQQQQQKTQLSFLAAIVIHGFHQYIRANTQFLSTDKCQQKEHILWILKSNRYLLCQHQHYL